MFGVCNDVDIKLKSYIRKKKGNLMLIMVFYEINLKIVIDYSCEISK